MPKFSVIVPTYNRPEPLRRCLQGLAGLEGGDDFEVVVVDDGTGTSFDSLADAFRGVLDLRFVGQPHRGPAAARNTGAREARGRYLVFLDDDCVPEPSWLEEIERVYDSEPKCLVGGGLRNALPGNPFSTESHLIVEAGYAYGEKHPELARLFNTANLAVPRREFEKLEGFSESFPFAGGEDYDFCHRWHRSGNPVCYAPQAIVGHAHPLDFRGFLRQHFTYGRGLLHFRHRVNKSGASAELRGPRLRFFLFLLSFPFRKGLGAGALGLAALFLCSQAATLLGAICERLVSSGAPRPGEPAG